MKGDDAILTEYLDGRLSPGEAAAFERRLGVEPALSRSLRLARAARELLRSSAPAMPADLKAALKREARRRSTAGGPRWLEIFRAALKTPPWAYGARAAFAAAALVVAVRFAAAPREDAGGVARRAVPRAKAAARAKLTADLWSDDDGSDHDD